jgi:DNA-binding MarR family transcriptional regulator
MAKLARELNLDVPFQDIHHEAALSIVRTASVFALAGRTLFRRFGLTQAQFNVLLVLCYRERPLTQSDLGKRLVVTRATITSILDKLEGKDLVRRARVPGNRRIHHVELTDQGRRLVEQIEPLYIATIHEVMGDLGEEGCRELVERLDAVREKASRIGGAS